MRIALAVALLATACTRQGPEPPTAKSPTTADPKPAAATPKGPQTVTVASFGGAYQASQKVAFFEPFTAATKITVVEDTYNGELAKVKAMVDTKNVTWDVVDIEDNAVFRGCDEGLLEVIDPKIVGDAADFLDGAIQECGIATVAWSTIYAYDAAKFPDAKPTTLADFFDLEKFPGKRAVRRNPKATLEQALLADGVEPGKIYATLGAPGGVERALKKLDTIKAQTVWWEAGAQPPQLLADGEVVMAQAWNGRIYNAQVKEKKDFRIVWDGQIYAFDYWAIPKGAPHKAAALEFIRFSLRPDRMAEQTKHIAYAPPRRSAMKLVDPKVVPHLPTAPANFKQAIRIDPEFWADHFNEVDQRFKAWLAK